MDKSSQARWKGKGSRLAAVCGLAARSPLSILWEPAQSPYVNRIVTSAGTNTGGHILSRSPEPVLRTKDQVPTIKRR